MLMMFSLIIPLTLFFLLLYFNTFISIEIPLINMLSFNISMSILADWMSCMFLSTVILSLE